MAEKKSPNIKINPEEKELVLERIKTLSDDIIISVGSVELTKEDLITNVESENETGADIIKAQMEFLKSIASGEIYNYV